MSDTIASQHCCIALTNTPDQLGNEYRAICQCGYRTSTMLHIEDAITLMMLHSVDIACAQFTRLREVIHNVDTVVDRNPVRRHWVHALRPHRSRGAAETKGPQAPPRHYHPEIWGQS